jgi:hypothetical protein
MMERKSAWNAAARIRAGKMAGQPSGNNKLMKGRVFFQR